LDDMAFVAVTGFLLVGLLQAGCTFYRAESKTLGSHFFEQFIGPIRQLACIPKRLAFLGDQNRVAYFEVDDRVEESQPHRQVIGALNLTRQRQFVQRSMNTK